MHIYQGVQDPDALAGITQLRHGGPTRSDCILAAQTLGRWSEAAAFHEVELGAAAAPNNAAFSGAAEALQHASAAALPEAYLQSFLSAGKPRLLLRVAEGCLSRAADVQSKVHAAAAGTAAAWRLTDWAAAERFLAVRHRRTRVRRPVSLSPALQTFCPAAPTLQAAHCCELRSACQRAVNAVLLEYVLMCVCT